METIYIPCVEQLKVRTIQCIDEFCVYSELLNSYFREESQRIDAAKAILQLISTKEDMNGSGLYDLLAECILTMVSEYIKMDPSGVDSSLPGIKKQSTETFHKDFTKALNEEIQELEKAVIEHRRSSRAVAKGLKSYCKDGEARHKMTQLADNILYNVSARLRFQLIDGLSDLRNIIKDYVSDQKLERLLSKINSVNITAIVEDLYRASSGGYTFPVSREYHAQYGFSSKLPRSTLTQVNKAAIINTGTEQEFTCSNNYIQAKSVVKISKPGFLTVKKGMRIKQKAYLSQENIGFGWTRTLPWTSKRWGFFETDIACSV